MDEHHDILKSIAAGDRGAFRVLYHLFSAKVYNTALSYAQNRQDAEDITQEVFAQIFRNAGKFRGQSKASTWIYRITVNAALNHLRRKKRPGTALPGAHTHEQADFDHPGVLLEKKENAKALFKAIDLLPGQQKTAFILSFVEELPRQEVADIMQVSLKAVESLLQRAKKNLREKLIKMYPGRRKNN